MKNINAIIIFLALVAQMGCLKTRGDVEEIEQKKVMQEQVFNLQKSTADQSSRFVDVDQAIRQTNGRIEVLENKINQVEKAQSDTSKTAEQNKKLTALEESVVKMDNQIQAMLTEIAGLKAGKTSSKAEVKGGDSGSLYDQADALFKAGDWKQAIFTYEKFREKSPKSKKIADATYKIGVCFQEMGMSEDAIGFYEEVISKFPKTEEAKKAGIRLKKVKK